MKNSTLFLAFLMLTFFSVAQQKTNLPNKILQVHEKNSKIIQKSALLSNRLKVKQLNKVSLSFKSAETKQKLDSVVTRILNADTQGWQYDGKDEFIYDSNLKNTIWLSKEWNLATKKWDTWLKTDLGYDNHNRVNSFLMSETDTLNNDIVPYSKMVIYYNSEGMQDSTLSYFTEDAGVNWQLDMRQINHYNASKKLTKLDIWALDEESGEFLLSMNVVYTYTSSGKIKTSTTNYIMEGEEITWSKIIYNYDGSEILTSEEDWQLNFMTFALEKSSRYSYQYNAAGDVSVDTYASWNGSSWIDEEKDESTYSTTNFEDVIFPTYITLMSMDNSMEFNYKKAITGTNTFEMTNGSWKNTEKTVFYYSGGSSTNIDETNNTLFTAYPNPASGSVSFRWKGNYNSLTLEMFQITGVKALEQIAYPGKEISISKLENGIYFFKLLNGQQTVHAGKLIKR